MAITVSDPLTSEPLYQQIIDQFTQQILSGALAAGKALPSIRQLAKEQNVSVITVKRAYLELERRGLIFTRPGKGSVVAGDQSRAREETRQALETSMREVIQKASLLGLSDEKLATLFYRVKQSC